MADLTTIQTRIDEIDAILARGIRSASAADRRTEYDLDALAKERTRLAGIVANQRSSTFRRVVFK